MGAQFKAVPLSFNRKEMHEPAYLAINPEGKVPTLVIDGRPLTEVAAILFYFARSYPAATLLPESIKDRRRSSPGCRLRRRPCIRPAQKAPNMPSLSLDRRLDGREWAVGRYSIADIHLFRLFWRFSGSLRPPPEDFPNLSAHYARMMSRDAVKSTFAAEAAVGYELPA